MKQNNSDNVNIRKDYHVVLATCLNFCEKSYTTLALMIEVGISNYIIWFIKTKTANINIFVAGR